MSKNIAIKKALNSLYGAKRTENITEITRFINNGVTHVLIAENKPANVIYTYYVYNAKNTTTPLEVTFDLYNKMLELFTIKDFKTENYIIINGVKWVNIENINMSTVGETKPFIDDALSHGFSDERKGPGNHRCRTCRRRGRQTHEGLQHDHDRIRPLQIGRAHV